MDSLQKKIIIATVIILVIVIAVALYFVYGRKSSSSSNSSGNSSGNTSGTCTTTNDCTGSQTCQSGQCANPPSTCGQGPACPTGQTCSGNACVDSTTICSTACVSPQVCQNNQCVTPPACTTGSCPNGQVCTNGTCVCSGDGQCGPTQWCNNGTCVTDACKTTPPMAPSPDGLGCYHGAYQHCTDSTQCPSGLKCDTTNGGYCIPSQCNSSSDCINTTVYTCGDNKQCEVTTCSMQAPCGPGFYCNAGKCNKATACDNEYLCPSATQACYNGMCMQLCNYTAANSCGTGMACIPKNSGSAFDISDTDGICISADTNNPHSVFNMPVGIQCTDSDDCPHQWTCDTTTGSTTYGECLQYVIPTSCSTTDQSTLPPNYHCNAGVPTLNQYSGCSRWQKLDVTQPTGTCSSQTWSYTDAVPLACLGENNNTTLQPNPIGYWGAQTNTGSSYFMTPVVFRLGGDGAPGYPLYGFYNSNTVTGLAFTTYDLGGWLSFDYQGALFDTAKNSPYKNCNVIEAAYLAMDTTNKACINQHIPAWESNMANEDNLTYDGVPFCYNTQKWTSEYVPSTFSGVRANLGDNNNYCVQPSNIWGPTNSGPASGTLATMMVYNSDGGNNNNIAQ